MVYLLAIALGYLLGCSSMALYISKCKKVDIRAHGSGNLGTSNTAIVLGWGPAIAVGAHDIGKGALAVFKSTPTAFTQSSTTPLSASVKRAWGMSC